MYFDKECFVICAIGRSGSAERKHSDLVLNYIIRPVVEEAGYRVTRADEALNAGMITVDTINSILDAELVVADLTFHNPNVFYELGLRHSTKRHTLHIASTDTDIPFDNADHRAVFYDVMDWESHNKCKSALAKHLGALDLTYVTNPVSVAQAHKNDARLTGVIDALKTHVEDLEQRVYQITDPPPPGHITRKQFGNITKAHRQEIMEIVKAIRSRIDQPKVKAGQQHTHVSDVLKRLSTIETKLNARPQNGHVAERTIQ